jgi:hypothetical protein
MKSKIMKKKLTKAKPADVPPVAVPAVRILPPKVRKVNNFESRLTILQVGDIVDLGVGLGGEHIVWKCNDCRALCVPTSRRFEFKDGEDGREIEFNTSMKLTGISPNSEVPILRRLGKSGMIEFLENKTKQKDEKMKTDKAEKKEKSEKPSLGKLGGFQGFAVTAAIRAMAVAGWEYWECRAVFDSEKVEVADNTIRIQLSAGRAGKGGAPAPLSKKYLASIRPDADEKPAAARQAKPAKGKKAAKKAAKPADDDETDADPEEEDEAPAPKAKNGKKPAAKPAAEEEEETEETETEDGE